MSGSRISSHKPVLITQVASMSRLQKHLMKICESFDEIYKQHEKQVNKKTKK